MIRAPWCLAALLALLGVAQAEPSPAPLNAQIILGRVRAAFHAPVRPPYVVYSIARHDKFNDQPDFADSYTLRIWCRTSDHAALARRLIGTQAEPPQFIHPAFDKPIDPGPPTADVFEALAPNRAAETSDAGVSPGHVIGSIAVLIEFDYIATYAGVDGNNYHLTLVPRRDPQRNRLSDVYVDRDTYALARAVVRDHLYMMGTALPEKFEIEFGTLGDIPIITAIHGHSDYAAMTKDRGDYPYHETEYQFTNIEFPTTLPDWYFDPKTYGRHRKELPTISR
jgi:hypothetical protein